MQIWYLDMQFLTASELPISLFFFFLFFKSSLYVPWIMQFKAEQTRVKSGGGGKPSWRRDLEESGYQILTTPHADEEVSMGQGSSMAHFLVFLKMLIFNFLNLILISLMLTAVSERRCMLLHHPVKAIKRKLGTMCEFPALTSLSPINQWPWTTLGLKLINAIELKYWSSPALEQALNLLFQEGNARERLCLLPSQFILIECSWKAFKKTGCWPPKMILRVSWLNVLEKIYQYDY